MAVVAKVNAASVPRSERILGRANCLATDDVGDCVRITGTKVGNRFQVTKVDPANSGEDQAVGIIVRKDDPTNCIVQFHGPMRGVYTGLTPGKRYWVGSDSRLTLTIGTPAVGGIFYLQFMGVATDDQEVLVDPHVPTKRRG